MLTVLTWLWRQDNVQHQYRPHHVQTLRNMVDRHLHLPHRFLCITDQDVPGVDCVPLLKEMPRVHNKRWSVHRPQCYRRLRLFDPAVKDIVGERYVQMDLDTVIVDTLDPLFDRDEDLVINAAIGTRSSYNGSMWMHSPGTYSSLCTEFNEDAAVAANKAGLIGSDQAWMRWHLGKGAVPTWSAEDGSYQYHSLKQPKDLPDNARIVFFAGNEKPWTPSVRDWVKEHYR